MESDLQRERTRRIAKSDSVRKLMPKIVHFKSGSHDRYIVTVMDGVDK